MRPIMETIIAEQVLAQAGSVTGVIDCTHTSGKVTVILISTAGDVTVTYKIGYTNPDTQGEKKATDATFITPDSSGAITNLTAVTVTTGKCASITAQPAQYLQFTITENNSAATTVRLLAITDRSI